MVKLIEDAFCRIFPDSNADYDFSIKYSGKFSPYNANVKKRLSRIEFSLSSKWRGVNDEIVIGLIQSLLLRILGKKGSSMNIDLYNNFVKSLHISIPKDNVDSNLKESFSRVNSKYFFDMIEMPNLVWGNETVRTLGSYNFKTDTITMSGLFKDADHLLVDYIMYHEMLHKKHQFKSKNGRSRYHDAGFRKAEKQFEDSEQMEKKINRFLRGKKVRKHKNKGVFGLFREFLGVF